MARLQQYYRETVVPKLQEELGIDNVMAVPQITKITLNMGVGEAVADKKVMDKAVADLAAAREGGAAQIDVLNVELAQAERDVQEAQRAIETMVLEAGQTYRV